MGKYVIQRRLNRWDPWVIIRDGYSLEEARAALAELLRVYREPDNFRIAQAYTVVRYKAVSP